MANLTATGGVSGPGRIGRVAIGDLLKRAAARFPDRVALTDGARRGTFTELERDANRFANYLVARGLKPGEKISTINNNSVEFVKALFGIHRAGLVWVPVNTMLGPADMDYILDHAEVRFALIDDNLHAQPDRRTALQKRGIDLIAVDLAGTAAAQGLENFNDLLKGQSDIEPDVDITGHLTKSQVIPDDVHDFLLYRSWKTVATATADFFERRLLRPAADSVQK